MDVFCTNLLLVTMFSHKKNGKSEWSCVKLKINLISQKHQFPWNMISFSLICVTKFLDPVFFYLTIPVTKIENRCFLKDTFAKGKKKHQKNKSWSAPQWTEKKSNFPLWKQNPLFWKIPPTLHPHSVFPRRYNTTLFYEKT